MLQVELSPSQTPQASTVWQVESFGLDPKSEHEEIRKIPLQRNIDGRYFNGESLMGYDNQFQEGTKWVEL